MTERKRGALAEHVEQVALIDHHVHGCWLQRPERERFENALNEANTEPLADFDSAFDTQLGFAVRAHCAPLLGLPRHAGPDTYWYRRSEYDEAELAELFLTSATVSDWLVDTGFAEGVGDLAQLSRLTPGTVHEVVRLETVAEDAMRSPGDYAEAFEAILTQRATGAVATKSILAYRGGFAGELSEPPAAEVAEAAKRWRDSGRQRLTDRVLLRFGLYQALRVGKPLQFHVGFGDRDCDLRAGNPLHLLDFLRRSGDTPIMLLHCYPYEREAGYLAQAFNNVYLDGGLAINYLGARAGAFIGRLLEMAPFRKIVYSSDGFGPAELHFLGARLWRNGIRDAIQGFVDAGEWSPRDGMRVVDMIANGNAQRVYGIG
ncbi:amidohydrolase family protein [Mycobacterium sp. IDR2000157661]|uniref:amidohydrolase family protein n=1 Tax=Mycobacterium sp. IDR2000157661 TaxID=2867005 RepID=UPI001EEB689D|nr:amidohydrolase family protein [Mycobacterium sp. IDR2000157661]ULE32374.1 amidohydrolase family protein [Mycobacterium sp. IDR2000157661]